jgi:dihydroneopterin aldolase
MNDRIFIKNLSVLSRIGLTDRERQRKQKVIVDLEVFVDLRGAGKTDDMARTINYKEILERVRKIALAREYKLLEQLAEEIASSLLESFAVEHVDVTLKKAKYSKSPIIGIGISRKRVHG